MARGDTFILQNDHDAWAGASSITIRPADGVEVCIVSILSGGYSYVNLTIPVPSDAGSSNYTYIASFGSTTTTDRQWNNCKIFIRYADYIKMSAGSFFGSTDRGDYHISGIVMKG